MSSHKATIRVAVQPQDASDSDPASSARANTPDSHVTVAESEVEIVDSTSTEEEMMQEDHSMQEDHDMNADESDDELPETLLTYLDPAGDLRLRLRLADDEEVFVVSSERMRSASKDWQVMIQEVPQDPDADMREISMMDDNGEAILVLVNVAHGRFRQISFAQAVEQIHELAWACEKYHCAELLMAHVAPWINLAFPRKSEYDILKWLRTSWVFGCEAIFEACLEFLVLNSYFMDIEENRRLFVYGQEVNEFSPEGIEGGILSELGCTPNVGIIH
jgi:hypothetical protein